MSTPDCLAAIRAAVEANAALYGTPCFTQADFERARKALAEKLAPVEEGESFDQWSARKDREQAELDEQREVEASQREDYAAWRRS